MHDHPYVLYVEDDLQSRSIMHILMEDYGLGELMALETSDDFLARLEDLMFKPDIIFLDIHVAPHNGFEMLAALRQHPAFADIPVVALTASVMNEEVAQLRAAGFQGVIAKPIDIDRFPQIFQRLLNGESIWRIV